LPPHGGPRLKVFRNECRDADSQVNIETILYFLRCSPGDALAGREGFRFLRVELGLGVIGVSSEGVVLYQLRGGGGNDAVNVDSGDVNSVG